VPLTSMGSARSYAYVAAMESYVFVFWWLGWKVHGVVQVYYDI
jgi:hypothetical protein